MTGFDPAGGWTVRVAIMAAVAQPTASAKAQEATKPTQQDGTNTRMRGTLAAGAATALKEFSHAGVRSYGKRLNLALTRRLSYSSNERAFEDYPPLNLAASSDPLVALPAL